MAQLVGRGAATEDALVTAASSCGVAVGGGSAAWLRNLRPTPPRVLCIRVAPHHHVVRRPGVDLRPRPAGATVQTVQGLPVLDVLGTVADCAAAGGEPTALHHELTRLVVTADALRLATPDDHAGRLARHPRGRGGAALRAVLADLAGSLSHSGSEARARRIVGRLLDRRGLLLHPRPLEVLLDGRRVAEADLPCVQLLLDVEVDGPHHLLPAQQGRDQRRDRLARQAGWTVERFPTELIDLDPSGFERQVGNVVDGLVRRRAGTG